MPFIVRQLGASIEIRYHDVPIFAPARAVETIKQIMRDHLDLALNDVVGWIEDEVPVNTGALSQSFLASISGSTIDDMVGRVYTPLAYGIVMDQGREPGARMPPIDAIRLWVKRKGIAKQSNTNFSALSKKDQSDTLDSLAWAIAKKIQRDGIQGRQFMRAGWAKAEPRVEGIFRVMVQTIGIALVEPDQGGGAASGGGSRPSMSSRYL